MSEPADDSCASAGQRRLRHVEPAGGAQRVQRAPDRRDDGVGAARGGRQLAACASCMSGAGPSFCAGADLAWMAKMAEYTQEDNLRDARAAAAMFAAIDTLPMPVIAQIHGAALGGGAGLAAVADIAVAADDATFGFTEVKLGLIPAVIAPYVLAKIGQSAARELFVTRPPLRRRARAGDRPRPRGRARRAISIDRVNKYLIELATNGPEAMSAAKALLRKIADLSIADAAPITAKAIAERRVSEEAQKLMKVFLKK